MAFALALLLSVSAHLTIAMLWTDSPELIPDQPTSLEVELAFMPAAADRQIIEAEPETLESFQPAENSSSSQSIRTPDRESPPKLVIHRAERSTEAIATWRPLKLISPDDWDARLGPAESQRQSLSDLPFRPGFRSQLNDVQAASARREVLARRQRAVSGLSDEEFGMLAGLNSETIKVDGRCAALRPASVPGGGSQWWFGPCMDTRQHQATLTALEYDGAGRVVAD